MSMSASLPLPVRAPHIPRSIDNTAQSAYMYCPREFLYSMHYNRRGKSRKPSLVYGTSWHAALETHYRTGGDEDAVHRAIIMSWEPHDSPEDHRTPQRCFSAYQAYVDFWGKHDDESRLYGSTIGFPHEPLLETTAEVWWPGALHPYVVKIDRIYTQLGLNYIEDNKTTSALGKDYFKQWDPSNQMMGYAVTAEELTGLKIAGVRINAHGVLKSQDKFERKTITYDPARLAEWKKTYNIWIKRIDGSFALLNAGAPEDEAFPPNFTACSRKYGLCAYADVCTYPQPLRNRILEQEFDVSPWDPFNPGGSEGGDA